MYKIFFSAALVGIVSLILALAIASAGGPVLDSDNDGVSDSIDLCQDTISGEIVNIDGCSLSQICATTTDYKNHGEYVSCVAHFTEDLLLNGIITQEQKDTIVSQAANSLIGK